MLCYIYTKFSVFIVYWTEARCLHETEKIVMEWSTALFDKTSYELKRSSTDPWTAESLQSGLSAGRCGRILVAAGQHSKFDLICSKALGQSVPLGVPEINSI